jgi:hypothetical protein
MGRLGAFLLLLLLLDGCGNGLLEFDSDQQGVYEAMQAWSRACERHDTDALWELLSRDAREYTRREHSIGPNSVVSRYRMGREALHPDSLISESRRREIERELAMMPPDPTAMSVREYHAWRMNQELTPDKIDNQSRLFARANIESIEVIGERATVLLKHGETRRYSWVREDGEWRFDVAPSVQRELERERRNE